MPQLLYILIIVLAIVFELMSRMIVSRTSVTRQYWAPYGRPTGAAVSRYRPLLCLHCVGHDCVTVGRLCSHVVYSVPQIYTYIYIYI